MGFYPAQMPMRMDGTVRPGYSSYAQLVALVSQGWRIEPPVYMRPQWRSRSREENTYHFILWRGDRFNLVSVPDSPELQQFLEQNRLSVDRL